ncbi:NYN domain-containing protein [Actinomadura scrupuli]|uniref:NYN domain-containing protein n=1 Tax=Actinomadura scrupuli TaxID=559629 RepID=UPI003D96255B
MSNNQNSESTRVAVYVDGFNLYHGIHGRWGRKYLWLDLEALGHRLIRPPQSLVAARYFSAPVRNDPESAARQKLYLRALRTRPTVDVTLGRFQQKHPYCRSCGATWTSYEEKETDVSIAVALVEDSVNDLFDTAVLISADSDLCPGIRAMRRLTPQRRIITVFPPGRRSDALRRACDGVRHLDEATLRQSQLPDSVPGPSGLVYKRPAHWN